MIVARQGKPFGKKNAPLVLHAPGGDLKVYFKKESPEHFSNVYLEGPVVHVFDGALEI